MEMMSGQGGHLTCRQRGQSGPGVGVAMKQQGMRGPQLGAVTTQHLLVGDMTRHGGQHMPDVTAFRY